MVALLSLIGEGKMLKDLFYRLFYLLFFSMILICQLSAGGHTSYKKWPLPLAKERREKRSSQRRNGALGIRKFHRDNFIVLTGRETGMFHVFDCVCNLIRCYEVGNCRGIEVNFGTHGVYYEPSHGKNWWSYYCKPIRFGQEINVKAVSGGGSYINFLRKKTVRKEIFNLVQRYIHIKEHIKTKIDIFEKENFKNSFVISVHYRGTDKIAEAPYVSYEKVSEEVVKVLKKSGDKKYKIFVATDEQAFLDYMINLFGDRVCYYKDAIRSTNGIPVHLDKKLDHYKCGEDALVDCILLSRGNFLIRSSSNLSRWSTYFNPNIPVVELNTRYNIHQP